MTYGVSLSLECNLRESKYVIFVVHGSVHGFQNHAWKYESPNKNLLNQRINLQVAIKTVPTSQA